MIIQNSFSNGEQWIFVDLKTESSAQCCLSNDNKKKMYINSLHVPECERSKGIGKKLQVLREKFAKSKGCTHTYLFVDEESWMKKWYNRRGYRKSGRYSKTEIFMTKKL